MDKVIQLQDKQKYKASHPNYGFNNTYDSWEHLCDSTIDIASSIAQKALYEDFVTLSKKIADEMIETAQETNV